MKMASTTTAGTAIPRISPARRPPAMYAAAAVIRTADDQQSRHRGADRQAGPRHQLVEQQVDAGDEEPGRQAHPRLGPEHQAGAHDARDRAAGADDRNGRRAAGRQDGHASEEAADEVQTDEPDGAQRVLDGVAEDEEEPHVAEQMDHAHVEEQGREHGEQVVRADLRVDPCRHQSPVLQERHEAHAHGQLEEKDEQVHADDGDGGVRPAAGLHFVADDGKHGRRQYRQSRTAT